GVIEGYMVETFENGTPYVYIYLDEDWKKQVGDTNIILGKDDTPNQNYQAFFGIMPNSIKTVTVSIRVCSYSSVQYITLIRDYGRLQLRLYQKIKLKRYYLKRFKQVINT
ncbi:MAG: hypothetical protein KAT05_09930, partial [Spirochaetes bacterium]|nr:hypothetical protein [Spirochaetota bacterium]